MFQQFTNALKDIESRLGVAANPQWIKQELQSLIRRQQFYLDHHKEK